ncbi:MAG: vitamin K epoxide reductase family protein [Thermodesulfobacteriota bacterium]
MAPIAAGLTLSALDWAGVCTEACAETSLYRLFGFSLPPLGVAYFALCGTACLLRRRHAAYFGTLALLFSGGLGAEAVFTYIQRAVIGKWCPMCVGVALCVAAGSALIAQEYFAERERMYPERERKTVMKRFAVHGALVLLAFLAGLGVTAAGLSRPDAHAAGLAPEMLSFGPADSTREVYIVSDWFCPACRVAEPEILKGAKAAMKQAKVVFVDYPIHRETINFIPYNLSFMFKEKEKYLQIREALAALALKTKEPTPEDVQAAVSPLGVKYVPLNFTDVMAGTQYHYSLVQKYKIPGTPAVIVTDTRTGKVKRLNGVKEITQENILRSIEDVSAN